MAADRFRQNGKRREELDPYWLEHRDRRSRTHHFRRPSPRERSREQLLRDWYGDDLATGEMLTHKKPAVHVSEAMGEVLASLGMRRQATLEKLRDNWAEIVGPDIAGQSAPVAMYEQRVDVEVSSAPWMYVLKTMHQPMVTERVAEFTDGDVTEVRFVPHGRR